LEKTRPNKAKKLQEKLEKLGELSKKEGLAVTV